MEYPSLKKGAQIALIAPSSPVYENQKLDAAVNALKEMGFGVKVYPSAISRCGYLSGTDAQRAEDVMDAFTDNAIDGIVCLRGGYGAARLLPLLNFEIISRHPKVFVGYSDTTALHLAIAARCGFATFHGPLGAELSSLSQEALTLWQDTLMGRAPKQILNPDGTPMAAFPPEKIVTGLMVGGNLTVLTSLLGTPYMPDLCGKILLLEDVGEKPYRVDGMLTHLNNMGLLNSLCGVVLGDFTDCAPADETRSMTVAQVFESLLPKHLPVLYGAHIGHGPDKITLPLNVPYVLDTVHLRLIAAAHR